MSEENQVMKQENDALIQQLLGEDLRIPTTRVMAQIGMRQLKLKRGQTQNEHALAHQLPQRFSGASDGPVQAYEQGRKHVWPGPASYQAMNTAPCRFHRSRSQTSAKVARALSPDILRRNAYGRAIWQRLTAPVTYYYVPKGLIRVSTASVESRPDQDLYD
ncbi:uncharacterized protein KY384_006236 [Bacidia gigantensis]|uniref:uncharacterized protein n=1 Tax=Bacidia gigantensis TaxID=2732470 RepID=UPI001D0485DB|nr:uncharacterized protein KY384_006236 [Bacidia gigantensis]KAG8529599.1 hypothetical protein KY384_006236 [Bacidia gigantensis]